MSANGIVDIRRIGRSGQGGLSSRRVELRGSGDGETSAVICFLPWLFNFSRARDAGLILPQTTLAYEMPHAIVSATPEMSVEALHAVTRDFLTFIDQRRLDPSRLTLVGLSIGNFAATYIANLIGARLCAVSAADRGEDLIWSSSLAAHVRRQAEHRGIGYDDFAGILRDYNPINNLRNIQPGSTFIVGYFDKVVPYRSARNVVAQARNDIKSIRSAILPFGHSGTLYGGIRYLRFRGLNGEAWQSETAREFELDLPARTPAPENP